MLARFPVGDTQMCVAAEKVRGSFVSPHLAAAPGAPPWIVGAYNRLGTAVAVIDAANFTGLNQDPSACTHIVLVETRSGEIGLAATGEPSEMEEPASLPGPGALLEVLDRESDLLLLDVERLAEAVEEALV